MPPQRCTTTVRNPQQPPVHSGSPSSSRRASPVARSGLGRPAVLVVAVALGVGSLVERSAVLFHTIKLLGAAYLIVLGVRAVHASWRGRDVAGRPADAKGDDGTAGSVREGFWVGVTNPKSVVFLTAVLPQFVDREAGHATAQMLVLGLAGALLQLLSDGIWGLGAATARDWLGRSPRRTAAIGGTGGLAMIGLGATVAFTGRAE